MKPREPRRPRLFVTVVTAIVVLALVAIASVSLVYRRREAQFASVCEGARIGDPIVTLASSFTDIDQHASGRSWHGDPSGPPDEHHWFRRTGLSRHQQCTVEVEPTTQRIRAVHLTASTDFSDCRDPIAYPRRHWLCVIGDSLAL